MTAAADPKLSRAALPYAPRTWLFHAARGEQRQRVSTTAERLVFTVLCVAAVSALPALWTGAIAIQRNSYIPGPRLPC